MKLRLAELSLATECIFIDNFTLLENVERPILEGEVILLTIALTRERVASHDDVVEAVVVMNALIALTRLYFLQRYVEVLAYLAHNVLRLFAGDVVLTFGLSQKDAAIVADV